MINKVLSFPNMKIVLFMSLVTILVSCHGLIYGGDTGKSYFDVYTAIVVENFRETMRKGNETLEIPILDPFKSIKYQYKIQGESFFEAEGYLNNLQIDKLSTYKAIKTEFSIIGIKINLHLIWDSIKLVTDYSLTGTLGKLLSVYGLGDINLIAEGLDMDMTMSFTLKDGNFYVRNYQSTIKLETFDIQITGLFNDEYISDTISTILSDIIPQLVKDYQEELTGQFNSLATDIINDLQKNNTVWDLTFNS
ncbi:hypothetical protein M0802_007835 [Mischocyttarus mexicanus]|nr:hypothetical protein M0802_007835 [Mischocyttarus mexicanus]